MTTRTKAHWIAASCWSRLVKKSCRLSSDMTIAFKAIVMTRFGLQTAP
jgi:hypothetical protein